MKNYQEWMGVKAEIHNTAKTPAFKEGEIWWCGMGENVGVEIDGKNAGFSRPVLIFKKLSHFGFLAIPLTSQKKSGSWYIHFRFKNRDEIAVLSQAKAMSSYRLYRRFGMVDEQDMLKIQKGFHDLYCKKYPLAIKTRVNGKSPNMCLL